MVRDTWHKVPGARQAHGHGACGAAIKAATFIWFGLAARQWPGAPATLSGERGATRKQSTQEYASYIGFLPAVLPPPGREQGAWPVGVYHASQAMHSMWRWLRARTRGAASPQH